MRISQLEYFVKVAECGSITRAAQELFISQPTLTKAIAGLEREYDIELLERTPKGVRMTLRGQEFLEYAKEVIETRQILDDTFRKKKKLSLQRFCLASSQFTFLYDMLDQLFRENSMQVNASLIEVDRGSVLQNVAERRANLGIFTMTDLDRRSFESEIKKYSLYIEEIADSGASVAMAPSSPFYDRSYILSAEASSHLQVGLDVDDKMIRKTHVGEMEESYDPEQMIFCNTMSAALYFMRSDGALAYIPDWTKGLFEREKDIRIVPLMLEEGKPYPKVSHLAWVKREGENLTILEHRFVHLLKEAFSGEAGKTED